MPVYKYKLKDKTLYYIKYSIGGHASCVRGFSTRQEAIIYEASLLKKNNRNLMKNFYVKDFFSIYCNLVKSKIKITSAHTKIQVLNKHIFPYFYNIKLKDIDYNFLNFIAKEINNQNYKNKTRLFTMLKEFLEFLMENGLDRNLNMSMLFAKYNSNVEYSLFDYYTREEFEQFLNVIKSPKYRLIFLMLFNYGLRIGELLGLKHNDITKERLYIRHCIATKLGCGQVEIKPKTKSSIRDYPLLDSIKDAYLEYVKTLTGFSRADYIFKASECRKLTIGETPIRKAQKKYEELSGLRHIKLHEFRHSCATELINNGFSPEQVAAWLGHSSSEITMRVYFHLFPSKKIEIATFYNSLSKHTKKYQKS